MNRNTIKSAAPHEDEMLLDGQLTDVLVRLWDEAEKSVAAQQLSPPMPRHTSSEAQPTHVRYTYD